MTAAVGVIAQYNSSAANGCNYGFYPGTDTVIFTTPYTYAKVISIIDDYQNITWSGSPEGSVSLNGTTNTVGTARTYDIAGAHVVETITTYSKPVNGPYTNFYGDYDGTTVTSICNGSANTFNFTINFCASNATVAAAVLNQIHLTDAQTVGVFLGGRNFSSCATFNSSATSTASPPIATSSSRAATVASISTGMLIIGGIFAWIGL